MGEVIKLSVIEFMDGVSVLVSHKHTFNTETHDYNWEGKERNGIRVKQGGAVCVNLLMSIYGHNRHHFSISCCLQVLQYMYLLFARYIFTKKKIKDILN